MVHGMVLMQHRVTTVGTWRLHRDEFNEVTRVQLLDQYSVAAAEFRKRFGADVPPEKKRFLAHEPRTIPAPSRAPASLASLAAFCENDASRTGWRRSWRAIGTFPGGTT